MKVCVCVWPISSEKSWRLTDQQAFQTLMMRSQAASTYISSIRHWLISGGARYGEIFFRQLSLKLGWRDANKTGRKIRYQRARDQESHQDSQCCSRFPAGAHVRRSYSGCLQVESRWVENPCKSSRPRLLYLNSLSNESKQRLSDSSNQKPGVYNRHAVWVRNWGSCS